MRVLFVHKNFPAQFGHIAAHLAAHYGFECSFVSERSAGVTDGVRRIQYKVRGGATRQTHYCSRSFENFTWHSHAVYEAMKAHPEIKPDLVVGHSGFGSTLFLADLYRCPIVNFFEWYYRADGSEFSFRSEEGISEINALRARARNAMLLADLDSCTLGYSPTNWQRSQFPSFYQQKLTTIFDGIDTQLWRPRKELRTGTRRIGEREIPRGTKIVTYVSRGFESVRGFDVFMRVARRICDRRNDVVFVCVGSDRVCYGADMEAIKEKSFRHHVLANDYYDTARFIFTGPIPPDKLVEILNLSDLHFYLTVPFVLSWSLMDALACGCTVLASDTEPVREMIDHGANGLLVPFYDVDGFVAQAMEVLDDPEAYRRLGEAGTEMVQDRYSLDVLIPEMLELYESAVSKYRSEASLPTTAHPKAISADSGIGTFERLAAVCPWPSVRPEIEPTAYCDAARPEHQRLLDGAVNGKTRFVLELGAWIGLRTREFAKRLPQAKVIAVEHWQGPIEREPHPFWKTMVPEIYEKFLANCWEWRDRILPVSMPITDGIEEVHASGIRPQVVYVNVHQLENPEQDLRTAWALFPDAILIGDNWQWSRAQKAVVTLVEQEVSQLEVAGNLWRIWRSNILHDIPAIELVV